MVSGSQAWHLGHKPRQVHLDRDQEVWKDRIRDQESSFHTVLGSGSRCLVQKIGIIVTIL